MNDQPLAGEIKNVAQLDLTTMKTPEDLARITSIRNVANILVPESLGGALAAIPMRNVAHITPVPDGVRLNAHTGVVTMDGAALAAGGEERTMLLVTGALVVTGPVERVGFSDIVVIGVLVTPEGSQAALAPVLRRAIGTVAYYPWAEGQAVRVLQGDTRLRGEMLANANGSPDDILLVAGNLLLTGDVPSVGYRRVVVVGELMAPEDAQPVLAPALHMVGTSVWYTAPPRLFTGSDRFGRAFFELLGDPVTLVLNGAFELERDVTVDVVREHVAQIVLNGALKAPASVVPVLQVLAVQKNGVIEPLDEDR